MGHYGESLKLYLIQINLNIEQFTIIIVRVLRMFS